MIYTFTLNSEPLLATIGASTQEKLEEALDESVLHIPITVRNYEYKMYGLLKITADDEVNTPLEFTYLIISDEVGLESFDGYYSHSLHAVEYTNKLDKYLVNSLTFTKPFVQKRRAPFEYLTGSDLGFAYAIAKIDEIPIYSYYFTNQEIVLPQIDQAQFRNSLTGLLGYQDVFVSFDGGTLQNISDDDATHTFTEAGTYTIDIQVYNTPYDEYQTVYRHYVRVVDEITYSLYDFISILRDIVPLESEYFHEATRIFDIDENLVDYFKSIEMPQMFLQKMTARQALNTMFKYINAISRLKHVADNPDELTVDFFNQITGSFNMERVTTFQSKQDAQQYATKAISWLENTLKNNFRDNPSVKSPADNRLKTVRAKSVQLTQTNGGFVIPLEFPIYELTKIEVEIPVVSISGSLLVGTVELENYLLDITTRTIEKRMWDLKTITNDFPTYDEIAYGNSQIGMRLNRGGNIYWERNATYIDPSPTVGTTIKSTLLTEMILEAVHEEFTLNQYGKGYTDGGVEVDDYFAHSLVFGIYIDDGASTSKVFRNLRFNIEYTTVSSPTLQVDRADVSNIGYYSEIRMNQQERYSDFTKASRDFYGKLQRSGVPNLAFSRIHTDTSTLFNVGQIDSDGYIITNRTLTFYNDFIEATYEATLNHNRFNEFMGIDQEYRVFENPRFNEIYKRHDFYTDYLLLFQPTYSIDFTKSTSPTYVQTAFVTRLVRALRNYVQTDKITYAFVRTDGFLENYPDTETEHYAIMTPVIADGGKGGFTFTFAFDDNLSAGSALYKKGSGFYNEPIKYTNDFGFFNKLWFGMGTSYVATDTFTDINETDESQFNEEHKYPLVVDGDSNYLGQSFLIHAGSADEDEPSHNPLIVKKDASSNYNFSYQVAVLPFRQNEYVIGQSFFTSNSLVFDISNSKDVYLYRYTDGTTYGLFDDLVLKDTTYATPVFLSQLNTNLSNGVFTFTGGAIVSSSTHTSWAIADEDGNLYLACNYPYNGVKFALRHYRDEILNIGNKPQGSNEYAVITKTVELTSITNFDLEYTRSQEGLRQALLDIETAFATEYTRTLTESQSAQDLNATTTFDIIYSRTQGELAEGLDIIGDYREWVSADEGNYNTSDYQVTLSGTFATQPELLSACYSQLDISSVNIYTVVRGESAIPGNYFYAKIYSTPQVTFDIEYEVTTQVISESAMRLFGASNEDEYTSAPPAIRTTITGTYSTQLEMIQGAYSQLDIEAINISTIIRGESSTSGVYFYCKIIHTITTTFDLEYQKQVFGEFELPELQIATSIDIENTRTAEEWEYIGTSSATYNATYAGGNSGTFSCKTSSAFKTELDTNLPATNYNVDYIVRVLHTRLCNDLLETCPPNGIVSCDTYYYKAVR